MGRGELTVKGVNHITFSVSDLDRSIEFYQRVLGCRLLARGAKLAYFDLAGLWLALNVEKEIPRNQIYQSYTHVAFSIKDSQYEEIINKLKHLGVELSEGRPRHSLEGKSIYFRDPDGHLLELHTKSREDRLLYLKEHRDDVEFY